MWSVANVAMKKNNPGCNCCGECCTQYIDEMLAAGIGGATATVSGMYLSLSVTTPTTMNALCGWSEGNRLCLPANSDVLLPETPAGSVYWGDNVSESGCSNPTPAWYGGISAGVGVGCDAEGNALYSAAIGFRYRIKVFFVFPGYNAAAILLSLGYTEVSTNFWRKESGNINLGLYRAATARKSTSGNVEVWDITGLQSFADPDPATVSGYTFASWSPWYDPVGSSLSGAVV